EPAPVAGDVERRLADLFPTAHRCDPACPRRGIAGPVGGRTPAQGPARPARPRRPRRGMTPCARSLDQGRCWRCVAPTVHLRAKQYSAAASAEGQDSPPTMAKITYIEHDGTTHTIEAEVGSTVMESALKAGVTGIVAGCGGACSWGAGMVYGDEAWFERTGRRSEEEEDQLDFAFDVRPNSRLSCQIKVTEALDGLVVRTPAYQGR